MPLLDSIKHAFALNTDAVEPTPEQQALVDRLCREVVRRRLSVPALMMLEMSKPLGFLAAQAIHFFTPLISAVTESSGHRQLAAYLERRGAIEDLSGRIEALETERGEASDVSSQESDARPQS